MANSEIGATGLNRSNDGVIDEEITPNLQGEKAVKVYKEMSDNDPIIGGILFATEMVTRGVEWDVEENPDAQDPEGDAEFLKSNMDDMSHSWPEHVTEVLSMIRFGWSWFEIVYKKRQGYQSETSGLPTSSYDDGKVGWHKFAIRAQESLYKWQFSDNGGVSAMVQKPAPDYDDRIIPIAKSLLFRTTSIKGNPEGRSALRNAYRPWYFKKHIEEQEAVGIERDLAGIPMAKVPSHIMSESATDEEKALLQAIKDIVKNIKNNKQQGIVWPLDYDGAGNAQYVLELMNSGGQRAYDTNAIIQRYDQRMAITVLADFILLGHEKVGSFALSSDKTDLFAVAIGAYLDMMEAVYNQYAVPRLFAMNAMDTQHPPRIKHKDIETPPLTDVITYVQGLVGAGVQLFPDEQLESHLRTIGGLPERSEEAKQESEDQDVVEEDPNGDA